MKLIFHVNVMKEFKSIFWFLVVVAIIIALSYWAYNNGYLKPVSSENNTAASTNTNNVSSNKTKNENISIKNETNTKTNNTVGNTVTENTKTETENKTENTYVGKEEVDQTKTNITEENKETSNETKAIDAVKKAWWGDENAQFSVDNSNTSLSSDEIMVKVTIDGAQYFYVYNIKSGNVNEF